MAADKISFDLDSCHQPRAESSRESILNKSNQLQMLAERHQGSLFVLHEELPLIVLLRPEFAFKLPP